MVGGQRQWGLQSFDPTSGISNSVCGRRIWKKTPPACEHGFTQSICLKLLTLLLLSLAGVDRFFANSAEFGKTAVVS